MLKKIRVDEEPSVDYAMRYWFEYSSIRDFYEYRLK